MHGFLFVRKVRVLIASRRAGIPDYGTGFSCNAYLHHKSPREETMADRLLDTQFTIEAMVGLKNIIHQSQILDSFLRLSI